MKLLQGAFFPMPFITGKELFEVSESLYPSVLQVALKQKHCMSPFRGLFVRILGGPFFLKKIKTKIDGGSLSLSLSLS